MPLVYLSKNWDYPDLMLQSPHGSGVWHDVEFTLEPVKRCDAVVVLNHTPHPIEVECPAENVMAIIQEPPTAQYFWYRKGFASFTRVYTPDVTLKGARYVYSHGALPWHIDRSYDFLKNEPPPEKDRLLSSIARREMWTQDKINRTLFLDSLEQAIPIDLWGHGFTPVEQKWEALAPYRYGLAIESYSGPHYWTEKISDCFLSWTMPIYHGATNIADYFPPESFVQIDITKPREARSVIEATIQTDLWRKNRDAIAYARELVLERYQIFPFVFERINKDIGENSFPKVRIAANRPPKNRVKILTKFLQRLFESMQKDV